MTFTVLSCSHCSGRYALQPVLVGLQQLALCSQLSSATAGAMVAMMTMGTVAVVGAKGPLAAVVVAAVAVAAGVTGVVGVAVEGVVDEALAAVAVALVGHHLRPASVPAEQGLAVTTAFVLSLRATSPGQRRLFCGSPRNVESWIPRSMTMQRIQPHSRTCVKLQGRRLCCA